jgi:hypothetical protein
LLNENLYPPYQIIVKHAVELSATNVFKGRHPVLDNVYMACGFSGHGIQQGPAVGRALTGNRFTFSFQMMITKKI